MKELDSQVAVIIGDLIDSKLIEDRAKFQRGFAEDLELLSKVYGGSILSPFTLTLGDEFQAVFGAGEGLLRSLFVVRTLIYPVCCRFSVAVGKLSTEINPHQSIGMDGPAFHLARAGIDGLKASGRTLWVGGLGAHVENLWSPAINLLWAGTESWNHNRLKVLLRQLQVPGPILQRAELDISQRSVYKNIADGQLEDWTELIDAAEQQLTQRLLTLS